MPSSMRYARRQAVLVQCSSGPAGPEPSDSVDLHWGQRRISRSQGSTRGADGSEDCDGSEGTATSAGCTWSVVLSARTIDRTSPRTFCIVVSSQASTLSRNNGSVLLARRLNHHIGSPLCVTVIPSSSSNFTSWPDSCPHVCAHARTRSVAAWASGTVELISPEATYRLNSATSSERGRDCSPSAAKTCICL